MRAELDEVEIALGPPQQRMVLAILAASANQRVDRDELIDLLWGAKPPASGANVLYTYVKRLRRLLEPDRPARRTSDRLPLISDGYCLRIDAEHVDVLRARRLIAEAAMARRRADPDAVRVALAEAGALWTGPVLADLPKLAEHPRFASFETEWQEALAWDYDAALELGQAAEVLSRLEAAACADPLEEAAHARLMTAYHLLGRRADAIGTYREIQTRLAEDLGVDPGPALVSAYRALLDAAEEPAPAPALPPSQLPPPTGHFTGREQELAELTDTLCGTGSGVPLLLLTGAGGIGKTALALEAAHRVRANFPDGQIFLDLNGDRSAADTAPVEDLLAHLLISLGAPPGVVSGDQARDVASYRTLVSGRSILLVLDNVAHARQIEPLIPPAPGSAVLVTSRQRLSSLTAWYAVHDLCLDTLPVDDSVSLLVKVIGAVRVYREEGAARRLIDLCDRFPLALRITAAKLAARPLWSLQEFVDDFEHDDRLNRLAIPGESYSVRAVFATAYRSLSGPAAAAFRALGLVRLNSFTVDLTGAMIGVAGPVAEEALAELHACHLVTEHQPRRYRTHDLVALFARDRLLADAEDTRSLMGRRLVTWYLTLAATAYPLIGRFRAPIILPEPPVGMSLPPMDTLADAMAVLGHELPNLLPVVRYAAEHRPEDAWKLAQLLDAYFTNRDYGTVGTDITQLGLDAAVKVGDDLAVALARGSLGRSQVPRARYRAALDNMRAAFEHHRHSGDQLLEAIASKDLAYAYLNVRRFEEAIGMYEHAALLFERVGENQMVAGMLNNVANAYNYLGRHAEARKHLARAFEIIEREPDDRYLAAMLATMGGSCLGEGDPAAIGWFRRSLRLHRKLGNRILEAEALRLIGEAHRKTGQPEEALGYYRQAVEIERSLNDLHATAWTLQHMGNAYRESGLLDKARQALEEALEIRRGVRYPYLELRIHNELARISELEGRPDVAERHRAESARLAPEAESGPADWNVA